MDNQIGTDDNKEGGRERDWGFDDDDVLSPLVSLFVLGVYRNRGGGEWVSLFIWDGSL